MTKPAPAKQKVVKRKRANATMTGTASLSVPVDKVIALSQNRFLRWLLASLLWSLALFLFLTFISFSPSDPNFDVGNTTTQIQNSGGVVGAYIGGTLLRALGWSAYLLALLFTFAGIDAISNQKSVPVGLRIPSAVLLLFSTAAITSLLLPNAHWQGVLASGWIGQVFGDQLIRRYLGVGGVILIIPVFLVALLGSFAGSGFLYTRKSAQHSVRGLQLFFQHARVFINRHLRRRERFGMQQEPTSDRRPKFIDGDDQDTQTQLLTVEVSADDTATALHTTVAAPQPQIELEIDRPKSVTQAQTIIQRKLIDPDAAFQQPDLDLLDTAAPASASVDEHLLKAKAQILEHKIKEYGIEGRVTAVRPGPVISVYEFKPAPGVKVNKIASLEDDLALATESVSIRIVAPIPGRDVVGIEIPNSERESVALRSIIESTTFWDKRHRLPIALGKDTAGSPVTADLAAMPHLLVAGATGAGKSVGVNGIIVSLLYRLSPKDLRLYLIDPKRLELSFYQGIPHLEGHDVVTDPQEALALLDALVREMEDRYDWMAHAKVRQLATYNKAVEEGKIAPRGEEQARLFPYLVCIIDELADLMMVTRKAIEEPIARLAQMARAAGIHLVLATQRPSVDVLTGLIKANFPTRIAFKVSSKADARVILDQVGAENLLGRGDMLFKPPTSDVPQRVHGAYVSEDEVLRVVEFWKEQAQAQGIPEPAVRKALIDEALAKVRGGGKTSGDGDDDQDVDEALFERAVAKAREEGMVSTSRIQRHLKIGYNRAARIMDVMEARGMVGPPQAAGKPRQFLGN